MHNQSPSITRSSARSLPPVPVLLVGLLAVSAAAILIRFARSTGAPAIIIAAYRLSFASLLLAPYVLLRHRLDLAHLAWRDWLAAIASGAFLGLHFATWISSLDYTTVAASVVLVSTSPLWVALASRLFLGEPLTQSIVTGLLLALAGGTIIAAGGSACAAGSICDQPLLGDFLALAGAVTVAGYLILGRRLRASLALAPYVFVVYATSAVMLLGITVLGGVSLTGQPTPYPIEALAWIALLAIGPQLIGHSSYNYALKYLPPTYVALVTLGEPIGSSLLAFIWLNEIPAPATWLGGALILVGIVVASRGPGKS